MQFPVPPAWVADTCGFLNWLATGPGVVSEYAREAEGFMLAQEDYNVVTDKLDAAAAALERRLHPADDYVALVDRLAALATLGAATLATLEAAGALDPADAKDLDFAAALLGALLPAAPTA